MNEFATIESSNAVLKPDYSPTEVALKKRRLKLQETMKEKVADEEKEP